MDVAFDTVITVDWSGGVQKSVSPCADAIWVSIARDGHQFAPLYFRSRQAVEPWLMAVFEEDLSAGRRVFCGFDFAFGYPTGFGTALTGSDDPFALWSWFETRVEDTPKANNRFELASEINKSMGGNGPFWGCPASRETPFLPAKKSQRRVQPFAETRAVETRARGAFSVWQLAYVGAVGSQVIMGLPVLERLRRHFAGQIAVWPFEQLNRPIAFVEVWPSLYANDITPRLGEHPIKDAVQMHVLTEKIAAMSQDHLARTLSVPATSEGWIFGVTR